MDNNSGSGLSNLRKVVDHAVNTITAPTYPPLNVYRDGNTVVVQTAPIDGLQATTVDIEMIGKELTISGETHLKESIPSDAYLRQERVFGRFSRKITIPIQVKPEEATAHVKHQVLTVRFPVAPDQRSEIINMQVAE